jgi:hypothetical protein
MTPADMEGYPMDLTDVILDDLEPIVGDSLTVSVDPSFDLVLHEVSFLQSGPAGIDESRSFSILFRGPTTPALEQATYILNHAELGELTLFLVPIAADDTGRTYEAVFNRLSG